MITDMFPAPINHQKDKTAFSFYGPAQKYTSTTILKDTHNNN